MIFVPIVKGFIGGAVGTLAMRGYWKLVSKLTGDDPRNRTSRRGGKLDDMSLVDVDRPPGESAASTIGRLATESATGKTPNREERRLLGRVIEWGYGLFQGGLYGALSALRKTNRFVGGAAWGLGMWLLGDELAVPALGLNRGPTAYAPSQHLHRLGAHLTYGVSVAAVTKLLGTQRA